jgi:hypothetical protein
LRINWFSQRRWRGQPRNLDVSGLNRSQSRTQLQSDKAVPIDFLPYFDVTDGREETSRAPDVFYWAPGHTVKVDENTSFIEFSPKQQLRQVYDHISRKLAAAR